MIKTVSRAGKQVAQKGQILTEKQIQSKKIRSDYYEMIVRTGKGPTLTEEELLPIVDHYLDCYLHNGVKVQTFNRHLSDMIDAINPDRDDIIATIMGVHGQIAAVDMSNKDITPCFDRMGTTLRNILENYNQEYGYRFSV